MSDMPVNLAPAPGTARTTTSHGESAVRVWPVFGVGALQTFLFLAHWFIFHTVVSFLPLTAAATLALGMTLALLSITFIIGTLLSFRSSHPLVSLIYKIGAIWLGMLNFIFWAALLCWLVDLPFELKGTAYAYRPSIAAVLFGLAILVSLYGFANARNIRERRLTVTLPKLPATWRGRTALLLSDIHLGHVNGTSFSARIAAIAKRLDPSIIFIAGDLFDGSKVDPHRLVAPLFSMAPPFGVYFADGNHEEFGDAAHYAATLLRGGIRVLHNERVDIEGLQVVGVSYTGSNYPVRLRTFLDSLNLAGGPASILLNHVPHRLPIVEQAGVTLQVSGHTHGGQIVPFTWIARRAFAEFTYGLQRFGNLQVLTSSGVGTWGPPMRVGTAPEVVLITFA